MKIVFMGTPDFAVASLEATLRAKCEVAMVVTQPDRPKGRTKAPAMCAVKQKAIELGLNVFQPEKVRESDSIQKIKELSPDIIVVAAFGQILPKELLELPRLGCINVHASLLPKYRGAAPIQWAILNGEKSSGITIMQMDEGLDTGDILLQRQIPIADDETAGSLFEKLSNLGAICLTEALDKLQSGEIKPRSQGDGELFYAKMITKEQGHIDFTADAYHIERLIRAMNPWPSAYTHLGQKTMKIWRSRAIEAGADGVSAGVITHIGRDSFCISCGSGQLEVLEVQLEGKKRMDAHSFLLGVKLKDGTQLL